jgi:5-methylcytosine-specific restriction protein A
VAHGRCAAHQQPRVERKPDTRASAAIRGYDHKWRMTRARFLRMHPLCEQCAEHEATDVHHIVPKDEGGSDAWDNLVALCHGCHSRVTARSR